MAALGLTIPAWASTALTVGQAVMGIASANRQAASIKAAGRVQKQQADYKANQLKQQAIQTRAASQRGAIEERRRGRLAQSRAEAVAAASGGSVADIDSTLAELGGVSEYNALMRIYEGEEAARGSETAANLALYEGDTALWSARQRAAAARREGYSQAASTLAGSSLFDKYAPSPSQQTIYWNDGTTGSYWGY